MEKCRFADRFGSRYSDKATNCCAFFCKRYYEKVTEYVCATCLDFVPNK